LPPLKKGGEKHCAKDPKLARLDPNIAHLGAPYNRSDPEGETQNRCLSVFPGDPIGEKKYGPKPATG